MKVLVQPWAAPRARLPVRTFLLFAALALLAFGVQRALAGGLSPSGVEAHYLGEWEGEALSAVALWEEVHAVAFLYGFVLFMLASLAAVSPLTARVRAWLVALAFAATFADLFAPFAVVALGDGTVRVVTFVLASASLAALLVAVAARFGREEAARA